MSLKEKLGEELYEQVQEKLGDDKIAIVSDGSYVPKEKFDEKNDEAKEYKKELKNRDEQLESLKKKAKGNEELEQELEQLKEANENTAKEYQSKLERQQKEFAVENALRDSKVKNPKVAKKSIDLDNITYKDGKLIGFDEQFEEVKEAFAFEKQEEPPKPSFTKGEHQRTGLDRNAFSQMSYKDRLNLKQTNPDQYKELAGKKE